MGGSPGVLNYCFHGLHAAGIAAFLLDLIESADFQAGLAKGCAVS